MIHHRYRTAYFYLAFAAVLAVTMLALSDTTVISQRASETIPLPFEFGQFSAPKRDIPRIISAGNPPGSLIEKWTFDFGTSEGAAAVAVQSDGKIVAAGTVHVSGDPGHLYSDRDFVIFRYNADGALDTTFDGDGKLTTAFGDGNDSANTVAIQTDGKIVAGGISFTASGNIRSALVRYNTDGSLDPSFGTGGRVVTAGWEITEVALQPDGKIVASRSNFSVVRYSGDGSLDASFGTGGVATTIFDGNVRGARSVAIQADGRIVAAGNAGFCEKEGCSYTFALARYNANGSPDTTFDTDGKVTTAFNNYDSANAVVLQSDGRIIAGGSSSGVAVARYNSDGSLDYSFDGDGKVTYDASGAVSSVALQSDGKIVLSGGYPGDFELLRLNADGSPDTSFDGDGTLTTDFGGRDGSTGVAVQANGKIVTVGSTRRGQGFASSTDDFALAQHNTDGSLDVSFDVDGKQTTSWMVRGSVARAVVIPRLPGAPYNIYYVGSSTNGENADFAIAADHGGKLITPIGNFDDVASAAAVGPDRKVIAAGYSFNGSNSDFALVRYNGLAVDTSFDGDGKVTTDFGGTDFANAVAVQPDGKIVAVGWTSDFNLAIARYNVNGSLDTSFGTGGKVVLQSIQYAKAMAIQPDGKILAAGSRGPDFAIARLNANGSLDTTFDSDGVTIISFGHNSQINSVALQPHGKIVAAGFIDPDDTALFFALARFNADGSPDMSFDGDGKVTTSLGTSSAADAICVQRNGKIVAVGWASTGSPEDFAIARYNYDGSLDTTFDSDGKQTTDFFGGYDYSTAATLDPGGNLIAVGSAYRDGGNDFAVARYIGDPQRKVAYDFDDDGAAELSVYRPSNGTWYLNRSTQGFYATEWGTSSDKIVPADYDGDGKTDIGVYRDGTWHLRNRFGSYPPIQWGLSDDIPVPADYDGDGRAELAVFRNGAWWALNLWSGQSAVVQFGLAGDKPVPADYDGDGVADQAVYRGGEWHINGSSRGYTVTRFGLPNDKPLPADYDGDTKADLAVYRDGTWYLMQSTNGFTAFQWGLPNDVPVPADYDGDGKTDAAVFRNGMWYLLQSSDGVSIQQFGLANDTPVPSAFTR